MKYRNILVLLLCLFSLNVRAEVLDTLRARVIDEYHRPVAYASIFLQKTPIFSTITGPNGDFQVSPEIYQHLEDTLMVSYIGYKSFKIKVDEFIGKSVKGDFVIPLEVVELKEAVVLAKPKKVSKRKAMRELLENVLKRMKYDFPKKNREYKVKSNLYLYSGEAVVGMDEAVGTLYELPEEYDKIDDSLVVLKVDSRNLYLDYDVKKAIRAAVDTTRSDFAERNRKNELTKQGERQVQQRNKLVENVDFDNIVHEMFWGLSPVIMFEKIAEKTRRWESTDLEDGTTALVYTDKRNFLGIIKYNLVITYVIDSSSYSLLRQAQQLEVKANIPFGYKLSEEQLELYNLFNMTGRRANKYKVKKMDGTFSRSASFISNGWEMRPIEKTMSGRGRMMDRKDRGIEMNFDAKVIVL